MSTLMIRLQFGGVEGSVSYSEELGLTVDFPDAAVGEKVTRFFTTPREFYMPEPGQDNVFRVETAAPTVSLTHMKMALCTLYCPEAEPAQ